ncbi:hypothetical protein O1L68_00680 [Streptomyces lydicus]|nr:hypothetical protein [Streptomyces lydicus]
MEAAVVAVAGGAVGLAVAALLGRTAFGAAGSLTAGWALAALAVGVLIAGGTVLLPPAATSRPSPWWPDGPRWSDAGCRARCGGRWPPCC